MCYGSLRGVGVCVTVHCAVPGCVLRFIARYRGGVCVRVHSSRGALWISWNALHVDNNLL